MRLLALKKAKFVGETQRYVLTSELTTEWDILENAINDEDGETNKTFSIETLIIRSPNL